MQLRRTCLTVPAGSPRMLERARTLAADEVILDLEDSLPAAEKDDVARSAVVEALRAPDWTARSRAVRVNGVATAWCWRDIVAVVAGARDAVHCLVLPKVEDASHVHYADHLVTQLELEHGLVVGAIGLELQIESARGAVALPAIAAASRRTTGLVFGPGDYAASIGAPALTIGAGVPGYAADPWHWVRAQLVACARANGQAAIDGPYAVLGDEDGLRASALGGRALGLDGKWAIHPAQLPVIEAAFAPSTAEVERARALVTAYDAAAEAGRGAATHRGEMIDEASLRMARRVLAAAGPR